MQIVIDIDEDYYELIKHDVKNGMDYLPCKLIANGTPLPKGHGKLIDADKEIAGLKEMKVVDEKDKQSVRFAILELKYADTIIEADKEQEE